MKIDNLGSNKYHIYTKKKKIQEVLGEDKENFQVLSKKTSEKNYPSELQSYDQLYIAIYINDHNFIKVTPDS